MIVIERFLSTGWFKCVHLMFLLQRVLIVNRSFHKHRCKNEINKRDEKSYKKVYNCRQLNLKTL